MTIKKIREHLEIRPFRPIVVRTVSGTRHEENHPDYLLIPPVGNTFLIVDPDGSMHHLDARYVEAVETRKQERKPASKPQV